MTRIGLLAVIALAPTAAAQSDPLREAESILERVGRPGPGGLRVDSLAAAPPAKPGVVGIWTTGTNEWEFRDDGSWQILGTRNRGRWKETAGGIAIQYAGATRWLGLTFVGETLVDREGYIGRATLRRK